MKLTSTLRTLFETKWLAIKEMDISPLGVKYIYAHATSTGGKAVIILAYRLHEGEVQYLLRKEVVPPWGLEHSVCSMTGGVVDDDPLKTAVMELREEAGYVADASEFVSLGTTYNSKAADTVNYIYTIDLTGCEVGQIEGDGSPLEEVAESFWSTDVHASDDCMLLAAYARLRRKMEQDMDQLWL